jgi:hypothetical protein
MGITCGNDNTVSDNAYGLKGKYMMTSYNF